MYPSPSTITNTTNSNDSRSPSWWRQSGAATASRPHAQYRPIKLLGLTGRGSCLVEGMQILWTRIFGQLMIMLGKSVRKNVKAVVATTTIDNNKTASTTSQQLCNYRPHHNKQPMQFPYILQHDSYHNYI